MDVPVEVIAAVAAGGGLVTAGLAMQLRRAHQRLEALARREPANLPIIAPPADVPDPGLHDHVFDMTKPDRLAGDFKQWRLYACRVPGCTATRTQCGGTSS